MSGPTLDERVARGDTPELDDATIAELAALAKIADSAPEAATERAREILAAAREDVTRRVELAAERDAFDHECRSLIAQCAEWRKAQARVAKGAGKSAEIVALVRQIEASARVGDGCIIDAIALSRLLALTPVCFRAGKARLVGAPRLRTFANAALRKAPQLVALVSTHALVWQWHRGSLRAPLFETDGDDESVMVDVSCVLDAPPASEAKLALDRALRDVIALKHAARLESATRATKDALIRAENALADARKNV